MSVVTNRTNVPVEVFGEASGVPKRWMLMPGRMTDATFDCTALRARDGGSIFETTAWWGLLRDRTVIYTYREHLFVDDLSLHCFPYGMSTPFGPGYRPVSDASITVDLDPDLTLDVPAPAQGPYDGEFDRDTNADADTLADGISLNRSFGRYVRTGECISVRVELDAFFTIDDAVLATKTREWKATVESTWNNTGIRPNGTEPELQIEIDYSSALSHYTVFIPNAVISAVAGFFGSRASYFYWPIDMTDNNTRRVAHEFGHHLGLQDEYLYEGEMPSLAGAVNQFSAFAGKKWNYSFLGTFLGLFDTNQLRAAKRTLAIPPVQVPPASLMENSATGVLDNRLIDRVYDRRVQPLVLTQRHVEVAIQKEYMQEDI